MKIECPKHGEVEFVGTGDFIGDKSAVTMYCPQCINEEQDIKPVVPTEVDRLLCDAWNGMIGDHDIRLIALLKNWVKEETMVKCTDNEIIQFLTDRIDQIST